MTAFVVGTQEKDLSRFALAIQQLAAGRSNAGGTVTLTPSSATTTVTDSNVASGSVIMFMPTTANAATEIGNGTMYVSAVANGSFTITHANSATTGRTFGYAIQG